MTTAIQGSVLPDRQPVITIHVRGGSREVARVQAVIDTGFNDYLTLPPAAIQRLQLPFGEEIEYALADGKTDVARQYFAEIEWLGLWRRILVTEVDGNALVGTTMMRGCVLTIEMIDGGHVQIQPFIP